MIFLTYIFKNFSKSWFFINYGDYRCSFFQLSSAKYNIFNIADNNIYSVLYFQKVFYFDFFNNIPLDLAIKKLPTHLILWNYYRGLLIPYWSRVVFKGKGYRMRKFKKKKKLHLILDTRIELNYLEKLHTYNLLEKSAKINYFFVFLMYSTLS